MKRLVLSFILSGAVLAAAGLADVRKVYMLPMANSLDQYLANRLTNEHVFEVVADPTLADAIFTDRLGEAFEARLADLLPPPGVRQAGGASARRKGQEGRGPRRHRRRDGQ